jgi:predicted Zn-dependent protease
MANLGLTALAVSVLALATACAASPRNPGLRALVSVQQEQAQAVQLERKAVRFRWDQQVRLDGVLTRLLLEMPDPPQVTVEVARCDGVNAYVGDGRIKVCLGMLRFVESDDELAVVVGHELGHLPTPADRGLLGGGQGEAEREADIRGLFYAYRAGFDIRGGAKVFQRMAVELSSGLGDSGEGGHPSQAERLILAERIASLLDGRGAERDPEVTLKRLHRLVGVFDDLL